MDYTCFSRWAIVCSVELQPDVSYYVKYITITIEAGFHITRRLARPHMRSGYLFGGNVVKRVLLLVMVVFFASSCMTSEPPPTKSPEEVVTEAGEVIFDGTECIVNAPRTLPPGEYSYVLRDYSEYEVQMYVGKLLGDKTTQDMLDLQGEPGSYVTEALFDKAYDSAVELGAARYNPDGGEVHTYKFISEGEYTVGIWSYQTPTIPFTVWFCAPLWIE